MKKFIAIILIIISFFCGFFVVTNNKGESIYHNFIEDTVMKQILYGCPKSKKVKPNTTIKFSKKF